tara:strand:+ start:314 stop:853 length:540 start_codon:yes stop_codon:yes gene_type:complete
MWMLLILMFCCSGGTSLTYNSPAQSRRSFGSSTIVATTAFFFTLPLVAVAADDSADFNIASLKKAKLLLKPLSQALEEEKWDTVRSVLKGPGVGELWNLSLAKSPVSKLAKLSDDPVTLLDLNDELMLSLQMADQITYANSFAYTQPGNGKLDRGGPITMIKKAISQLDEIIVIADGVN